MNITIAIPTLNEEDFLPLCLDDIESRIMEVYQSNLPIETIETIILDSQSSDSTLDIACNHPVVDKIIDVQSRGILNARHAGFVNASGDIVIQADADTEYSANHFVDLLYPFFAYENVVMTWGRDAGEGIEAFLRPIFSTLAKFMYGTYVTGANRAVCRDSYFKIGGYNLDIDQQSGECTIEEESLFPQRIAEIGHVVFVPNIIARQSGRNTESILSGIRKPGGTEWHIFSRGIL